MLFIDAEEAERRAKMRHIVGCEELRSCKAVRAASESETIKLCAVGRGGVRLK